MTSNDFIEGELDGFHNRPAQKWAEEYQEGYSLGRRALLQDELGDEE